MSPRCRDYTEQNMVKSKKTLKIRDKSTTNNKWKEKAMDGKFPNYLDNDHVRCRTIIPMDGTTGPGETEGLITAAQDQALNTRYYSRTHHQASEPLTDAECEPSQKLWNTSYQDAKH